MSNEDEEYEKQNLELRLTQVSKKTNDLNSDSSYETLYDLMVNIKFAVEEMEDNNLVNDENIMALLKIILSFSLRTVRAQWMSIIYKSCEGSTHHDFVEWMLKFLTYQVKDGLHEDDYDELIKQVSGIKYRYRGGSPEEHIQILQRHKAIVTRLDDHQDQMIAEFCKVSKHSNSDKNLASLSMEMVFK